mmetsp:Transcript_30024/g.46058  ORF Transcript_30024/g.46058 Transcript_30024/m.46058 type:complete len:115 (-) Transcript_30024:202-546(-)
MPNTWNSEIDNQDSVVAPARPRFGWKESPEQDRPTRRIMRLQLVQHLRHCDPTESSTRRLAAMAFKLEPVLYMSSSTKEEYLDKKTLNRRLQMISQGLVVLKAVHSIKLLGLSV